MRTRALFRAAAFALVVLVVLVLGEHYGLRDALQPEKLRAAGASPGPGLVGAWLALWYLMMGSSMPAIVAGTALFGWVGGTLASLVGALIAHSTWFWLARHSLRELVVARSGDRVRWLIGLIDRGGPGLVIAYNMLGGPGVPFLFAAALSRLPYPTFALGVLSIAPRALLTALVADSLLRWEPAAIPDERWLLLAGVGVPMIVAYLALLALRPELRPWRFGDPLDLPEDRPAVS